jgi:hypothetical protein
LERAFWKVIFCRQKTQNVEKDLPRAWKKKKKYSEKFSEFLSDFYIAKTARQYF